MVAWSDDYCEVCGCDELEKTKVMIGSRTVWLSKCIQCGHEAEICSKSDDNNKKV